jgi:predicted transcriptional regulator
MGKEFSMAFAINIESELENEVKGFTEKHDISVTSCIRNAIIDKLDDEKAFEVIKEYERDRKNGSLKLYSSEEIAKRMGNVLLKNEI